MEINKPTQPSTVKFNQSEIDELTSIRKTYEDLTVALGQLEMQKREVSKNEKRINDRLTAAENQEKVFLDNIVAKYGEGTFDITTGVFTPKSAN
jgi:predicted  nucleic acid-binding Zn-ribbon protein